MPRKKDKENKVKKKNKITDFNLTEQSFNENLCHARKNQKNNYHKQCSYSKKKGNFCGTHKNYLLNKLIPFNEMSDETTRKKISYNWVNIR